jgi:hypothetical protein
MWTEILKLVEKLADGSSLDVAHVNAAVAVELRPTLDTPVARQYEGRIARGAVAEVELRVIPPTRLSVLVLRGNPECPLVVTVEDLRRFGPPKWRSVEPKALPEGSVAECYDFRGLELRVEYRAKSRRLEALALSQQAAPAGR